MHISLTGEGRLRHRKQRQFALLLLATILGSTFLVFSLPASVSAAAEKGCHSTIATSTTLTSDIGPCKGNAIIIGASHIVLNCAGHTITGNGSGNGIALKGYGFVTVENCNVIGFANGFYIFGMTGSNNNTLKSNTANGNQYGFYLKRTGGNKLSGNTANGNSNTGIYLYRAQSDALTGNTANSNGNSGFQFGSGSTHNTVTSNTANSNSQYGYWAESGRNSKTNTFSSNECSSNLVGGSDPTGLCIPQP